MRLCLISLLSLLFLSCAEKVQKTEEDFASVYASTVPIEGRFLKCNTFSDNTFHGKVKLVENKKDCIDLKILKYPDSFFNTEQFFLQAYPLSLKDGVSKYGKSLSFTVYENGEDSIPLVQSSIIDSFLVEKDIKSSTKNFFQEHYFRICDVTQDWDMVQLVTYLRKDGKSNPARLTKFLIPPFLSNPSHFKQDKGDDLGVYHPFFDLKNSFQIEPSSYYQFSQSLCSSDF